MAWGEKGRTSLISSRSNMHQSHNRNRRGPQNAKGSDRHQHLAKKVRQRKSGGRFRKRTGSFKVSRNRKSRGKSTPALGRRDSLLLGNRKVGEGGRGGCHGSRGSRAGELLLPREGAKRNQKET